MKHGIGELLALPQVYTISMHNSCKNLHTHTCSANNLFSSSSTPASGQSPYTCFCPLCPDDKSYRMRRDNAALPRALNRSQLSSEMNWFRDCGPLPQGPCIQCRKCRERLEVCNCLYIQQFLVSPFALT